MPAVSLLRPVARWRLGDVVPLASLAESDVGHAEPVKQGTGRYLPDQFVQLLADEGKWTHGWVRATAIRHSVCSAALSSFGGRRAIAVPGRNPYAYPTGRGRSAPSD